MKKLVLIGALLMCSTGANAAEERVFTTFGLLSNTVSIDALGTRTTLSQNYFELGNVAVTRFDPVFYSTTIYGKNSFMSLGLKGYYSLYQKDSLRIGLGAGVYADLDTAGFKVGDTGLSGSVKVMSQSHYPWLYYADYTMRITGTQTGVTNSALSAGVGYSF